MNARPKDQDPDKQPEKIKMKTACEIVYEMLRRPPVTKNQRMGSIGINTSGDISLGGSSILDSHDEDTNTMVRAHIACGKGMVVSPLSEVFSKDSKTSGVGLFYTTPAEYPAELQKVRQLLEDAKREEEEEKQRGWFGRRKK